jgi:general secretion pathway protein B
MSYILEALKKAQAERQIGETPTIHAPTLAPAAEERSGGSKRALLAGVGVLGGAVVVMGAMLLRQQPATPDASHASAVSPSPAAMPAAAQPSPGPAPAAAQLSPSPAPAAAQPSSGTAPAAASPTVASVDVTRPTAPTVDAAPHPVAPSTRAARPTPLSADLVQSADARASSTGKPANVKPELSSENKRSAREADTAKPAAVANVATASAPAIAASAAAPVTAAPAGQDDHVQSRLDLPEPIQRAIPPITMGGYMYSKNPADRLILIDKVLRKEGDEVAPGLLLEKLLPKSAIFVFRGYRYKVPL